MWCLDGEGRFTGALARRALRFKSLIFLAVFPGVISGMSICAIFTTSLQRRHAQWAFQCPSSPRTTGIMQASMSKMAVLSMQRGRRPRGAKGSAKAAQAARVHVELLQLAWIELNSRLLQVSLQVARSIGGIAKCPSGFPPTWGTRRLRAHVQRRKRLIASLNQRKCIERRKRCIRLTDRGVSRLPAFRLNPELLIINRGGSLPRQHSFRHAPSRRGAPRLRLEAQRCKPLRVDIMGTAAEQPPGPGSPLVPPRSLACSPGMACCPGGQSAEQALEACGRQHSSRKAGQSLPPAPAHCWRRRRPAAAYRPATGPAKAASW